MPDPELKVKQYEDLIHGDEGREPVRGVKTSH